MVSMKRSAEEKKDMDHVEAVSMNERDDYPYGLSIDLDEDSMEKLDFTGKVGDTFTMTATVRVTSTRESKGDDYDDKSAGLQIEEMELKKDGDEKSAEELLYGEGDS